MKNKLVILLSFLFLGTFLQACAQKKHLKKDTQAVNILNYNQLEKIRNKKPEGKITYPEGIKGESTIFDIETLQQPKFIYHLSTAVPLKRQSYPEGQVFLLSFDAKTLKSSLETGEAKVFWKFRQSHTHKNDVNATMSLSSEWQTYYIPFKTNQPVDAKDLGLVMQYGFKPQEFLLKNIKFLAYPQGTHISELPKTKITYKGMEADATWRQEALKRIDNLRKTDFSIVFTYQGKPLSQTPVTIEQTGHEFPFGALVSNKDVINNTLTYQKLKENFNLAVFENDLKIRQWQKPQKRALTLQAIDQLNKDGIQVKGHVLIWPGYGHMSKKMKQEIDNNPENLKRIIRAHLKDILTQTKGKITYWDVVNEVYTNKDFQKLTGSEDLLYEGFKMTARLQPEAKRFTNEYGIISKGGIDRKKQKWYYDFIKRIDEHTGGLVDGIGIQSHIGSDLTPPEKVLEILDFYAPLKKDIAISEFTMDIKDPEIREQYTRDFMIAAFSHPNVSQFLFWGLVKNDKGKVDVFNQDGSLGAMGKAYIDLTQHQWHTKFKQTTDHQGQIKNKGFYGTYAYALQINGKKYTGSFKLTKGQNHKIYINLK